MIQGAVHSALKDTPGVVFDPLDPAVAHSFGHEDDPFPQYLWCATCRRTFRRGLFQIEGRTRVCPYPRCRAPIRTEAFSWDRLRQGASNLPEDPPEYTVFS